MDELYDALIDGIPSRIKVRLALRGRWQGYVEADSGAGVSSLLLPGKIPYTDTEAFPAWEGRPLRELAAEIKKEDGVGAALGCAALNAWYNTAEQLSGVGAEQIPPEVDGGHAFRSMESVCRGKIVSTVGHFHGSDDLTALKELRIFEKEPRPGDYPETMEEKLLPGSDIVFITGMALTNKTMPHLLGLCRDACVVLSGPSVPMAAVWKEFGVDVLYGTMVWDVPGCRESALNGGHKETWPYMGKTVLKF